MTLGDVALYLFERTAEFPQRCSRNADARVLDQNKRVTARNLGSYRDAATFLGELDGICQEVQQNLLKCAPIPAHG